MKNPYVIIAGVAAVIIAAAIVAHSYFPASKNDAPAPAQTQAAKAADILKKLTLDDMRHNVEATLSHLETVTPAQWELERVRNPKLPATPEPLIKQFKARQAQLQTMTPEQWHAEQQKMLAAQQQRIAAERTSH